MNGASEAPLESGYRSIFSENNVTWFVDEIFEIEKRGIFDCRIPANQLWRGKKMDTMMKKIYLLIL